MTTPTSIDTNAPVIARHELLIAAPIEYVWAFLTDIEKWPQWQTGLTDVRLDQPLVPGQKFYWTSGGLPIESTVYLMQTPRRIMWGGPAQGIMGIHEWSFTEQEGGVLVQTRESWDGEPIRADVDGAQRLLDGSIVTWLEALKKAAERSAAGNRGQ